jgi:hypothetical protein
VSLSGRHLAETRPAIFGELQRGRGLLHSIRFVDKWLRSNGAANPFSGV